MLRKRIEEESLSREEIIELKCDNQKFVIAKIWHNLFCEELLNKSQQHKVVVSRGRFLHRSVDAHAKTIRFKKGNSWELMEFPTDSGVTFETWAFQMATRMVVDKTVRVFVATATEEHSKIADVIFSKENSAHSS